MSYDELMERIMTAQEEMLKHSIEANSVTLNGRKYGKLIENLPTNIKPTIFGMAVKADYALPDDYDFLVQYEPPKLKTNADRIRSMTDKELASFLAACDASRFRMRCDTEEVRAETLRWIDWLKREVENEY